MISVCATFSPYPSVRSLGPGLQPEGAAKPKAELFVHSYDPRCRAAQARQRLVITPSRPCQALIERGFPPAKTTSVTTNGEPRL